MINVNVQIPVGVKIITTQDIQLLAHEFGRNLIKQEVYQ